MLSKLLFWRSSKQNDLKINRLTRIAGWNDATSRFAIFRAGQNIKEYIDEIRGLRSSLAQLKRFGFRPRTVIDVGVAWGTPALYETFPKAEMHLIEPLPEFDNVIAEILKQYSGVHYKFAAGENAGVITIRVKMGEFGLAGASLNGAIKDGAVEGGDSPNVSTGDDEQIRQFTIEVKALDEILDVSGLKGPVLLKIDAQGYDLSVLKSAPKILEKCEVVVVETAIFPIESLLPEAEQNLLLNVVAFMDGVGFVVYDIVSPLYRDHDGALAQVDLFFVRKTSDRFAYRGW